MKTGVEKAFKMGCDTIIFVDSDGQHNPKHLPEFKRLLKRSNLVFGKENGGGNADNSKAGQYFDGKAGEGFV